jgi:hypothetical protein
LLDIPWGMAYSGTIGTDPALKSSNTSTRPQPFTSTEFWRRLHVAKTINSLEFHHCPTMNQLGVVGTSKLDGTSPYCH